MIDLTPLDVRKKRGDFKRGLRGYDIEEVDSFLELVAERMEELVRQNLMLAERVERLDEQVRSQVGREQAVNEALVTAQQLRTDISGQAQREAEAIRSKAEAEARAMGERARADAAMVRREVEQEIDAALKEAGRRLSDAQESLEGLERNRTRFLKSFRSLLEREIDGVEVEEGRSALDLPTLDLDLLGGRAGAEIVETAVGSQAQSEGPGPAEVGAPEWVAAEEGAGAEAPAPEETMGSGFGTPDAMDPMGSMDPMDPMDPIDPIDPVDPMDSWTTGDAEGRDEGPGRGEPRLESPGSGPRFGGDEEYDAEAHELAALESGPPAEDEEDEDDPRPRRETDDLSASDLSAELDDLFSGAEGTEGADPDGIGRDPRSDRAGFRLEEGKDG